MGKTLCAEVLIKGKEKKNLETIITIIIEKTKILCSSRDSCLLL